MQVITNEVCRGNINVIRWSPDSEFVAASCLSGPSDSVAAIVHVVRYCKTSDTVSPLNSSDFKLLNALQRSGS